MKATREIIVLISLLAVCSGIASAQVTTGTPPFGSFGGGPDVVNLANLNTHLTIPILNKPGRGLPFSYNQVFDSSLWYPVISGSTTSWQPATYWGWSTQTALATGYVSYTLTSTLCYSGFHIPTGSQVTGSHFVYMDQFGVPHRFAGVTIWQIGTCGSLQQGLTAVTPDGSGYTLKATYNAGSTILSRSGKVITPVRDRFRHAVGHRSEWK